VAGGQWSVASCRELLIAETQGDAARKHFGPKQKRSWLFVIAALLPLVQVVAALPNPSPLQQQAAEAVVRDMRLQSESSLVERNLEVLAPFTALPAGAALHVVSARASFAAGTWMLRLDCASRRDCLPFHAVLRMPPGDRLVQPDGAPVTAKLLNITAGRPAIATALARRAIRRIWLRNCPGCGCGRKCFAWSRAAWAIASGWRTGQRIACCWLRSRARAW